MGDVLTPWSNPPSDYWNGTSFSETNIGIQILSFNPTNKSYTIAVRIKDPISLAPAKPQNLKIENYNGNPKLIWDPNLESDVSKYKIYKKKDSNNFVEIATVLGRNNCNYVDTEEDVIINISIQKKIAIEYKVKAIDTQGKESNYSEEVKAHIKVKSQITSSPEQSIRQRWNGSAWVDANKYSYRYDENNNRTEELVQQWNGSAWVKNSKILYTYEENNNLTEELWQEWDGSIYVNSKRISYTYDENNNLATTFSQTWDGSAWGNVFAKLSYTYDENNNLTEELLPGWKISYTYDENNNQTEELALAWEGYAWVKGWKRSYAYDENNNLTERVGQSWVSTGWFITSKYAYTYDENNNLTEVLGQKLNENGVVNYEKYLYKYGSVTKINEDISLINSYILTNNYPNPFNPSTTINYSIPKQSYVILKIYDILGKEIANLVNEEKPAGTYELNWNALNLPSGVYIYQLKAGSFVESKKMILMK